MYYRKFYIKVLILLIPGFFIINSLTLLAFTYTSNYVTDVIPMNCTFVDVQPGIYSNYYVSKAGNDNNSGLSPELAWKTIAKINLTTLAPGSTVYFKRGDEWRERLIVNQSGTASLPITYTAYGTGVKPIINGADVITGWHKINSNIWGTVDPSETPGCTNVIIDNVLYTQVATLAELTTTNRYWVKTASTPDSIYVYSTTNPDSRMTELSHRNECIRGYNKNYINISYLELKNASWGISLGGTLHDGWCNIDSVYAYRNRLAGIEFVGPDFSHNTVSNCVATYNGNGILGWEGINNTTFSHCYTAHGIHNYIQAGTKSASADGSGFQFYISDNVVIEYCESDNDASGIYLDPAGSAKTMTARYNYVHDSQAGTAGIGINHFTGGACWIYYNLLVNAGDNEVGAFNVEHHEEGKIYVYNNTFYNNSLRLLHYQVNIAYGDNIIFKNNIFYMESVLKNYFPVFKIWDAGAIISDYNQWYKGSAYYLINRNSINYVNLAAWKTVINQDINSQEGDPLFLNKLSDWKLQAGSPCINKGVDVGLKQDFLGNPIVGLPDIGAFETQVISNIPVYLSSAIENVTPARLEMTYNMTLANVTPAASAFSVLVNSVARTVSSVVISGTKVLLTLSSPVVNGNVVTVAYAKPSTNPLKSVSGGIAASIINQKVVNNCFNIAPATAITSPINNSLFTALANITITANASDIDGSVSLVEFYNGSTKIGSKATAPYSFTWNNVAAGVYSLTVIATDNLNMKTISSAVSISVINVTNPVNQPPVVEISNPIKGNKYVTNSTITIDAVATDPDGSISKVEFYSGKTKLIELTSPPYSYTWKDVAPGSYSITAIATDNLNATTTSSSVEFVVWPNIKYDANSEIIDLFPNPNDGHFTINFIIPLLNEKSEIIINDLAGKQLYHESIFEEETSKQFDLSNIKPGIYIMMIICKKILVTKKFIKN